MFIDFAQSCQWGPVDISQIEGSRQKSPRNKVPWKKIPEEKYPEKRTPRKNSPDKKSPKKMLGEMGHFINNNGWDQSLERPNVERPIFRKFDSSNIKITKVELFDFFNFKFISFFCVCLICSNT